VNNGTSGEGICGATDVADGAWHHVAVTRRRSDGLMRIFVDGQIDAQADGPEGDLSYRDGRSTGFEDDPYLVIGAEKHDAGSSYPSYSGWIDEVRLSNTIRYTSDFTSPDVLFIPDANTVALYHLDEGPAGPCTGTVPDSSGASGGPSNGFCRYGGAPAGPVYTTDTPFTNTAPTPTPTPDTAPPLISDEEAAPLDIVAWVAWNTNEPATSQVEYGISPTLSLSTTETRDYVTAHKVTLTGLSSGTAYVYRVHSKDGADNATVSAEFGFTTLASQDVRRIYLPLILKSF
jgi:hypothetical protein